MDRSLLVKKLLAWYSEFARPLPWRETPPNPYHVWLSEIMLQQTRINAVRLAYAQILEVCPTVEDLARLPEDSLLKLWQGLGYYSRARNLHAAARVIATQGHFPTSGDEWRKLPGIGDYTAGAIASIVLNEPRPAVDGNVLRVLSRFFAEDLDRKKATALLAPWMNITNARVFTQAWMELGEVICLPHGQPHCAECPLQSKCQAHQANRVLEFPSVAKKSSRPITEYTVFRIVTPEGLIALRKRPASGLLAKMWEFPNAEGRFSLQKARGILGEWGLDILKLRRLPLSNHLFTHREWHMTNYEAAVRSAAGDFVWATQQELSLRYAIPSAFHGILPKS